MNLYDIDAARNTYYLDLLPVVQMARGKIDPTGSLEAGQRPSRDWGVQLRCRSTKHQKKLPDGSFYQAWRVERAICASPLILERYPLDRHNLNILVENS